MKYTLILTVLTTLAFMTQSCSSNTETLRSGIVLENLDTTVAPGTDFYRYAGGGWMQANPLAEQYARFGWYDKVGEINRERLHALIQEIASSSHPAGSLSRKIADFYNMAMDSVKLNADGISPIQGYLDQLGALDDKTQITPCLAYMLRKGAAPFFAVYVSADPMNSSMNLLQFYQSGLAMGERDYYLKQDEHNSAIRQAYAQHVEKMFLLCRFTPQQAASKAAAVLRIETRLAEAHYDKVKNRDPYATYNKMDRKALQQLCPNVDWEVFFRILQADPSEVSVGQPEVLTCTSLILADEDLPSLIAYLQWNLIDASATKLSDDLFAQNFEFYGKTLSGTPEPKPRWKRAQAALDFALGEAIGQLYVKKFFPPEAKERMLDLVRNLQKAYARRIENLDWMSAETKTKALEKLQAFAIKIGYPDKWKDYTPLEIKNDSYFANSIRSYEFVMNEMLERTDKPVDRSLWGMTPQTVNAYYSPVTNEICFPAGILQYPFFDMQADAAANYGAIGVVIGHEMTHGFDDQGRQFDKAGNLVNWWTPQDAEQFKQRAQVMCDYFDKIEVAPGVHANGAFTLGETLADYGGLQIAWQAFKSLTAEQPLPVKDGFTPEQRFFLSYALVWAGNIRPEEVLRRTQTDPHALGKWRVNGELPHIDAWYQAFDIGPEDPMYIPKEQRVTIW